MSNEKKPLEKKLIFISDKLDEVILKANKTEKKYRKQVKTADPRYKVSALNLLDYLAFRSFDIDKLQRKMLKLGFSDLSHINAHVMHTLLSIKEITDTIIGRDTVHHDSNLLTPRKSTKLLDERTKELFGKKPEKRKTRIMVTMPTQAAEDELLIEEMLNAGMNCARINCAHDNSRIWDKIIKNIRKASEKTGRECSVIMDIAGPKIRTGSIDGDHILLKPEETLVLTRKDELGRGAVLSPEGSVPARISCTMERVFRCAAPGERVFFDDGKIEGTIQNVSPDELEIRITNAKAGGSKLKADKGINFPDTALDIAGFTAKDRHDLKTILKKNESWNIDAINLSFVNSASELDEMTEELREIGLNTGIIIKIETEKAFENLPDIILSAMKIYPAGIMLARGDLAIETGWKNYASIQEEIIRIAEAANIPLIWATQVLENLAKDGVPTRAEITDAAFSQRASCVMLNKGKYIVKAIKMLDKILRRMEKFKDRSEDVLPKLDGSDKLRLSHKKYDIR